MSARPLAQSTRLRFDRATTACWNCRRRKVRCTGDSPCKDCIRLRKECVYPSAPARRTRKNPEQPSTEGRFDLFTSNIDTSGDARPPDARGTQSIANVFTNESPFTDSALPHPQLPTPEPVEDSSWEYHEPWSWTSICSEVGCRWIFSVTGSRDFVPIAKRFAKDFVHQSSPNQDLFRISNHTEPDEATAWAYVDAFYENCWEADLGIIDRHDFEALLQSHYKNRVQKEEPAWFALRNVVFAGGYRSLLAKNPGVPFVVAQEKARSYFSVALSVLIRLLIPPSSLMAIRAVLLMACYAEGLGTPAFKHLLCANSVHLALTKGLHRQPDRNWGISEDEYLKRNRLWWATYSFEKLLAFCGSRPSAIDDAVISAQLPQAADGPNELHIQTQSIGIRLSKIQSQILRQLLSFKALSMSPIQLVGIVKHLHDQLKELQEDVPPEFRVGMLGRPAPNTHLVHILYIHFSIYGSIMAVHTHFFYPWLISRFLPDDVDATMEAQIALSSSAVAEAARKILVALRLVNTSITSPSWVAFYYPIYAFINLFVYVLKYPTLSTATADLGLLDVCAGHFGYIDYLTSSQVSISLPREATNFASKVVKAARSKESEPTMGHAMVSNDHQQENFQITALESNDLSLSNFISEPNDMANLDNIVDRNGAGWNLLSSFDTINSNFGSLGSTMM